MSERNQSTASAVIFDFDGVITSGDTMASLVRARLRSAPARAVLAVPAIVLWSIFSRTTRVRAAASRAVVRVSCGGLGESAYHELARAHGTQLAKDPAWVIAAGVAAICAARDRGAPVVITSGTEETLVRAFLEQLDLGDIPIIGSSLSFSGTRIGFRRHNFGRPKVAHLEQAGWRLEEAQLYTDSLADLDLARRVGSTQLVRASRRDRRIFRSRVPHVSVVESGWA